MDFPPLYIVIVTACVVIYGVCLAQLLKVAAGVRQEVRLKLDARISALRSSSAQNLERIETACDGKQIAASDEATARGLLNAANLHINDAKSTLAARDGFDGWIVISSHLDRAEALLNQVQVEDQTTAVDSAAHQMPAAE